MERRIYSKLLIVSLISLILVTIGLSYLFYDIYLDFKKESLLELSNLVIENPEIKTDQIKSINFEIYRKDSPPEAGVSQIYIDRSFDSKNNIRFYKDIESISYVFLASSPIIVALLVLIIILLHLISSYLTQEIMEPIGQLTQIIDGSIDIKEINEEALYPELRIFLDKIQFYKDSSDIYINKLKENESFRRDFTANVSHELKTPLTSINGYAELIKSGLAKDEDITKLAGIIHQEGTRLLDLINSIINLSSLDDPKIEVDFQTLNIKNAIIESLNLLEAKIQKKGLSLSLNLDNSYILGDKRMIDDLLFNLLDNAIKYNVYNGSISISLKEDSQKIRLIIQDTGIGISDEDLDHIFERFYMVDKSRSARDKGTGLGLSIVKHILLIHQAKIAISSELGQGSRISIDFQKLSKI